MEYLNFNIIFYRKMLKWLICFAYILAFQVAVDAHNHSQRFDSLVTEIESISFTQGTRARVLVNAFRQTADKEPANIFLRQECLYIEAVVNYEQGIYDSLSVQRIQNELNDMDNPRNSFHYALLRYALVLNKLTEGSYGEAFTNALYATDLFKQQNDSLFITKSLFALGRICYYIENYSMSEDYFNQARNYTNPSQVDYYKIMSSICNTWAHHQRLREAIDSLQSLLVVLEKKQDIGLLAISYMNMGIFYSMNKENDKAYDYYLKAENFNQTMDNSRFSVYLHQNLGVYYLECNDLKSAHQNFQLVKKFADQSGSPDLIANASLSLSYIYEILNNVDSAFFYLKNYTNIKLSTLNRTNPIQAYQAYVAVLLEASNKELMLKEQEISLKNKRFLIAMILATASILLIVSLLVILRQQQRNSRQQALLKDAENRDLEERLQSRQEIERLQEERIAAQIREITSYSLALSNKNELLQQIAASIQRLPKDEKAIDEIRHVIKNNLNTDKVWDDFVIHFNKVHPNFFERIKSLYSNISEGDLRLCAYFLIGLSAKQIAQMLNISHESIKVHRYRLKKKLGLSEEQKLDDFIRSI